MGFADTGPRRVSRGHCKHLKCMREMRCWSTQLRIKTANEHVQTHVPRLHVSWPLLVLLVTSRPACGLNTHMLTSLSHLLHRHYMYTTNLFACPATDDCPVLHPLPQLVTESKEGGEHSPPLTTKCPWEDLVLFLFFVFLHVVSKVPEHTTSNGLHRDLLDMRSLQAWLR